MENNDILISPVKLTEWNSTQTWHNRPVPNNYFWSICLSGHSCVFVKDMAYYLVNRLDTPDLLPDKYIHTFLIRDPKKSVYSLYKMSMNKELTGKYSLYSLYNMSMNKELPGKYSLLPLQDVHEQRTHWLVQRNLCTPSTRCPWTRSSQVGNMNLCTPATRCLWIKNSWVGTKKFVYSL